MFRNDLTIHDDGTRTIRFTDVTEQSGIAVKSYGMGVATGDFNNDGCVDLYVTALGPNQLFRNNCDGTFTDVSKASGTDDPGWSVSATFFDYDRDGYLDLFVGNYVDYSVAANRQCFSLSGSLDYCPPHVYRAAPSHLYHNNHDGTFTDVTVKSGIAREYGPALGAVRCHHALDESTGGHVHCGIPSTAVNTDVAGNFGQAEGSRSGRSCPGVGAGPLPDPSLPRSAGSTVIP